jgi:hypothetical protein
MKNSADVTDDMPIADSLQSFSGGDAVNLLVASYDILFFGPILLFCPGHHTRQHIHTRNI